MKYLLRIIISEKAGTYQLADYKWLEQFLWKNGFSGLTVRRSEMNLNYQNKRRISILEDQQFNDLSLIVETIDSGQRIMSVLQEIKDHLKHGQISIIKGMEEKDMSTHDHFAVKVYTKEENSWFRKEEYEKVIDFFQEKNAIWTSMTKGIVGYGKDHVIHKQKLFARSEQTPIVIECVVSSENLDELLQGLDSVVEEGAIFTTPIHLIANK
ncbi:DUF190 domain-containing protein [Tetragenococcus halophilus]|uniref:DUF190 domain-containing protein n=1 Tax=Tetragenococcus halophilus TaxID=51669 RepID=UPI0025681E88|nr:DUF190 domain-containing protein [Tetragenococcus halophilus]GMG67167.1 hypothetical protein TEHMS4_01010 [Tetragenococcus halophilus]